MDILEDMLVQIAVYWPPGSAETGGTDWDEYGRRLFGDPVEIACRWEDTAVEFMDPQGTKLISRSVVYADRDLRVGGLLLLGSLDTALDYSEPARNEGAYPIRNFGKLPTLEGDEFLRTAWL
jgi:hypothetical protein